MTDARRGVLKRRVSLIGLVGCDFVRDKRTGGNPDATVCILNLVQAPLPRLVRSLESLLSGTSVEQAQVTQDRFPAPKKKKSAAANCISPLRLGSILRHSGFVTAPSFGLIRTIGLICGPRPDSLCSSSAVVVVTAVSCSTHPRLSPLFSSNYPCRPLSRPRSTPSSAFPTNTLAFNTPHASLVGLQQPRRSSFRPSDPPTRSVSPFALSDTRTLLARVPHSIAFALGLHP